MSYWVYLENEDGAQCSVERHQEGGTYAMGGTTTAELNVTYNYGWFYHRYLDDESLRWLDGQQAADCIERLEKAVSELGTDQHHNYWAPTPGNAGYALSILLTWAKEYPNAHFRVE